MPRFAPRVWSRRVCPPYPEGFPHRSLVLAVALAVAADARVALTAEPKAAAPVPASAPADAKPTILIQATLMEVPADFMERTGLPPDAVHQWILTPREVGVLTAAMRFSSDVSVLSRPQIQMASGQAGKAEVGQTRQAVVGLELSVSPSGELVTKPKTVPVWTGYKMIVTPTLSADGKSIKLVTELVSHQDSQAKPIPITLFVTLVFEGGSTGVPVPVTQHIEHPAVGVQAVQRNAVLPEGGTVVLGGIMMKPAAAEGAKPEGKGTVLLLVLTPYVVKAKPEAVATPAGADVPAGKPER